MGKMEKLYEQHRRLLSVARELSQQLSLAELERNAFAARQSLSKLVSELVAHLAFEDDYLYPRLLAHSDPAVHELARRYVDEMGGLRQRVHGHNRRWLKATVIAEQPGAFMRETGELLLALQDRVDKEDNELYPLVDE